jgi:hypothetical protein
MAINGLPPLPDNPNNTSVPNRPASNTQLPSPNNNFTQSSFAFVFSVNGQIQNELTLSVNPEEYSQTESSTSNVILTAGDVFSDSFGPGLTKIKMSGTFGQRPLINGAVGSGHYEAMKLKGFFRQYLDALNPIITPDRSINSGALLQFYNQKDNEFWNIELPGDYINVRRSKTSPFLYRYDLNFIAMCPSTPQILADPLSIIGGPAAQVAAAGASLNALVSTMTVDEDNTVLATGMLNTTATSFLSGSLFTSSILAPLTALNTAVANYLSNSTQVIDYNLPSISDIVDSCQYIAGVQGASYNSFLNGPSDPNYNPGYIYNPTLDNYLTTTVLLCASLQLSPNSFAKNYIKSDFSTQTSPANAAITYIDLAQVKSVKYLTIIMGDSIESLAIKGLGSFSKWKALAEFNNLVYPYIYFTAAGEMQPEKTLGLGQQIAIPITDNSAPSNGLVMSNLTNGATSLNYSFGTDLYLDPTGDINLITSGTTTDLQTISGIANLIQAITLKLSVYRGELLSHQDYGIPNLLGYRTLPLITSKAISDIQSTVLSDPRISSVSNVTVSIQGDIFSYSMSIFPNFSSTPVVLEGTFDGN